MPRRDSLRSSGLFLKDLGYLMAKATAAFTFLALLLLGGGGVALLGGGQDSGNVGRGRGLHIDANAHDYSGSVSPLVLPRGRRSKPGPTAVRSRLGKGWEYRTNWTSAREGATLRPFQFAREQRYSAPSRVSRLTVVFKICSWIAGTRNLVGERGRGDCMGGSLA